MQFRIAHTFTASLRKLDGKEQKAVKDTAFELQLDPANPGMQFHRIDRSKDASFWSVRASRNIRLILHKTDSSLLLCYVDHHDAAYQWAERRRISTHPKTGAAQIVELRETREDVVVPNYMQPTEQLGARAPLFAAVADEALLDYGVPADWLPDVREIRDEDSLFGLIDHLPAEAGEALIELATGGTPTIERAAPEALADPFDHPDAQRRFYTVSDQDELAAALDYPWDQWTIFLHPSQKALVERDFSGPARVAGSAGTGKTVVALHRAVHLARTHPEARILLTTFNQSLANALRIKLRRLTAREPRLAERIEVAAIDAVGRKLYDTRIGKPHLVTDAQLRDCIEHASIAQVESGFSRSFLLHEWSDVLDAWQLQTWEDYRDVKRLGRKTRLPESKREALWSIFCDVRAELEQHGVQTMADLYRHLTAEIAQRRHPPYDFVVVDEAQDVKIPQLRFLAALGCRRADALFFAGDLGQRIFQTPFSWKSLGVDIRGRSRTLKINYRTSHQIRSQADRLLDPSLSDLDGNTEDRRGTVSMFNGPRPVVETYDNAHEETRGVADWLRRQCNDQGEVHEIGIIVRCEDEMARAEAIVEHAGLPYQILDANLSATPGNISLCTMPLAKGLEFRAVAVIACDDEIIPLQARIEAVGDEADLEEVYNTERHLLYVACTRARDNLLITAVDPASEFLDDLRLA